MYKIENKSKTQFGSRAASIQELQINLDWKAQIAQHLLFYLFLNSITIKT